MVKLPTSSLLAGSLLAGLLSTGALAFFATSAHAQAFVQVRIAPPAPRVEVVPVAPSPRHIWVPGHWGWNGNRHLWVGGYYDLPPHQGYHMVPAHWVNEGGNWTLRQQYWTPNPPQPVVAAAPAEVVVQGPPPPPQEEIVPPSPGRGQVWIPGYQRWDPVGRRYAWETGRYQVAEPGRAWIPAHWVRTWRGWQFQPGHWRGHHY